MAVKFAGTMNAINRGLESTKAAKGADMVEDWEAALADLDTPGAKGILRDLASLRAAQERAVAMLEHIRARADGAATQFCATPTEFEAAMRAGLPAVLSAVENGHAMGHDLMLARKRARTKNLKSFGKADPRVFCMFLRISFLRGPRKSWVVEASTSRGLSMLCVDVYS